jgi:CPA1 family monovalent cation:H+ antiporter
MHGHELELLILALLAGTGILVVLTLFTEVPYPILLVLGGLGLSFVPTAHVELNPDIVFLLFLPLLLYAAAFFTSLHDLRENLRPIGMLAVGLVLATMVVVAVVAHLVVPGLGWPAAFVLGAIVSPTDPVAATAVARRVGAPRRVVTIVEGEALINDGTALVLYKFAVAAAVTGSFSIFDAGLDFVLGVAGGVAIGLAIGWLVAQLRRRLDDPLTEITISLITPYFAYLPAELAGASGVIAAVTTGVFLGWRSPDIQSAATRLQAFAVFEVVQFLLNAALFILVGLQLPVVTSHLSDAPAGRLALEVAVLSVTVMGIRVAYVLFASIVPAAIKRRIEGRSAIPDWRSRVIVAWAGMRGAVTLAAALALPLETGAGDPFPSRELVVFFAFAIVVVTLVAEGLTLPRLIQRMGAAETPDDTTELQARVRVAEAAVERIEELEGEPWVREDSAERLRALYEYRRQRFGSRLDGSDGAAELEERTDAFRRLRLEVLAAERETLVDMRHSGTITEEVMRTVEHDLDLEQRRLET